MGVNKCHDSFNVEIQKNTYNKPLAGRQCLPGKTMVIRFTSR